MCGGVEGQQLLDQLEAAFTVFPACNAVACLKAQQEVRLGRLEEAMTTLGTFLGLRGFAPSLWALQTANHIAWLKADIPLVCLLLPLLAWPVLEHFCQ